jgi:FMN-dependent NADH-azoreductase
MTLLHIDASPLGDASISRQLTSSIVAALRSADPSLDVTYRDLAVAPPDHLSNELLQVVKLGARENLTDRQKEEVSLTDTLVEELLAADVVVIGAPMYNFSIPTQLKAWIDRIAQPGRTFRYTERGPVGLAGGKKVIIASSRGGIYAGTPAEAALDHQEAFLRAFLGFIGVTDVTIIRAEGVAYGPDARAKALADAQEQIDALALPIAA